MNKERRILISTIANDAPEWARIDFDVPLSLWMEKLVLILSDDRVIKPDEVYNKDTRIIVKKGHVLND